MLSSLISASSCLLRLQSSCRSTPPKETIDLLQDPPPHPAWMAPTSPCPGSANVAPLPGGSAWLNALKVFEVQALFKKETWWDQTKERLQPPEVPDSSVTKTTSNKVSKKLIYKSSWFFLRVWPQTICSSANYLNPICRIHKSRRLHWECAI